jgi:sigma-B regulation protein RsbU (phosphoserine phosphatase)
MALLSATGVWGLWRRAGRFDRAVFLLAAAYPVAWALERVGITLPGFLSFLFLAAFFFAVPYLPIRWLVGNRERLLWSLRNRLVVAYLFIAVVPTLLVVTLGWLTARMFYQQVAAYVVYGDVQQRLSRMAALAEEILALPQGQNAATILSGASKEIPGLTYQFGEGEQLLKLQGVAERFAGLVQDRESVWMRAVVARGAGRERRMVQLSALLESELASTLAADLGPLQFTITRKAGEGESNVIPLGGVSYFVLKAISANDRSQRGPSNWFDFEVNGYTQLAVTCVDDPPCGGLSDRKGALIGWVRTRNSRLNARLFSQPGEVSGLFVTGLVALAITFLLIEAGALVLGIRLTQTITGAVSELYSATESVKAGDLTHRVRARERDQLGALGESFNAMIGSVSALIEEQKQRQRLENELAIAQQVQAQLFPQELPKLPRLELAAVCRAARVVSGDYYDFIPLDANRVGIAIADISGKGISAALLMASLQAALRSQVLLDGALSENTAELVTRLNRHMYLNTSSDRYATFFYATYDSRSGALHYTNAGHLPPLYVVGDKVRKLEEGGMVVGLFDDCVFEQGRAVIEPGGLLVAYSDGLVEPENVYGEQFGIEQLTAEVLRQQHLPPQELAEALVRAAEEWAGTQEQADDMTVIVARVQAG